MARAALLDLPALVAALAVYRRTIVPGVHREQRRWVAAAGEIPDSALRAAALAALRQKGLNAEATAALAILAPRARRAVAVRAMTALQTAVDYLDSLGEQPVNEPLSSGLAMHRALEEAVSPCSPPSDWYRLYPHGDDGGYLAGLVRACQDEVAALPAWEAVLPALTRAARRCGEGQSHAHAAGTDSAGGLETWATQQGAPPGYLWWEVAAGANSSVAAHALIAAAADPRTSTQDAEAVDATYFPPVGALTVLLDDLIDLEQDRDSGEHNYMTYYPSPEVAADRLALIASRARENAAGLRRRRRHAAVLAGVAGFYLSAPDVDGDLAEAIRARMLASLGASASVVLAAMRGRHRLAQTTL
jgi:tetraprenyl-beta-curcumene synthase